MRLHEDELVVSGELVRRLVDEQMPGFAELELRRLPASGSTNVLFRLGTELLVRLPRQPGGSITVDKEIRYLPLIGSSVSVRVPTVVAVGERTAAIPSDGRWCGGSTASIRASPRRLARRAAASRGTSPGWCASCTPSPSRRRRAPTPR